MNIVFFITDIINSVLWFICLNHCLEMRFNKTFSFIAEFMCASAFAITAHLGLAENLGIKMLLTLYLLCTCLLVFKDHWAKKFVVTFGMCMVVVLNEIICLITYFPEELIYRSPELPITAVNILSYVIYLSMEALALALYCVFVNRSKLKLGIKEYILLCFIPLSQLLLYLCVSYLIVSLHAKIGVTYFMFIFLLLFVSNAGLIIIMQYVSQRKILLLENRQMSKIINQQEQHYNELTENYKQMRRMRHDMENQLNVMRQMVKDGKREEASEYIENLIESGCTDNLQICKNSVLDSFLKYKIQQAAKAGISVHADIKLGYYSGISNVNLVRAFGNILDNAIEAASELPDSVIEISSFESRGYLVIKCSNPYTEKKGRKAAHDELLQRGIGNTVLSELARSHGGEFRHEAANGIYSLELIMAGEAVK